MNGVETRLHCRLVRLVTLSFNFQLRYLLHFASSIITIENTTCDTLEHYSASTMAVLDAVPGIRVTVESGGKTLEEYPDEAEFDFKTYYAPDECKSKSYIECISDAEFQIKCEVLPGFVPACGTHVYFWAAIDGRNIGGYSAKVYPLPWTGVLSTTYTRISDSEVSKRSLKFCSIKKGRLLSPCHSRISIPSGAFSFYHADGLQLTMPTQIVSRKMQSWQRTLARSLFVSTVQPRVSLDRMQAAWSRMAQRLRLPKRL